MIYGHGDDLYSYPDIQINFSSNCYTGADHSGLVQHLVAGLPDMVRSYPHPDAGDLKAQIAQKEGLETTQVAIYNGATEAIYAIARMRPEAKHYIAGPTFSEYEAAVKQVGAQIEKIDIFALHREIRSDFESDSVVWICNPNNPDGSVFEKVQLCDMIRKNPDTLFVIDQSYADFTDKAVLSANDIRDNTLIVSSLTKQYTIPGLRLGYVIGSNSYMQQLNRNRMPWAVNAIAIAAGKFLLSSSVDFSTIRTSLHCEVKRIRQRLLTSGYFEIWPTDTHYMLIRLIDGDAALLKETLAQRYGLLVRNAENFAPHYKGCFRIAVRTPSENELLLNALIEYASSL